MTQADQLLTIEQIDELMPEAEGFAEDNIVRNADGTYDFDEVPAWTRAQVHATVLTALAAYRAQAGEAVGVFEGSFTGNIQGEAWLKVRSLGPIPEPGTKLYASPHQVAVPLTDEQIEALAHRIAWRYKKSSDPHHSDTYTFNRDTLIQFAAAIGKVEA